MKTELEIEIKKIRKKLRLHGLTEDKKTRLRENLEYHKALQKKEGKHLIKHIQNRITTFKNIKDRFFIFLFKYIEG